MLRMVSVVAAGVGRDQKQTLFLQGSAGVWDTHPGRTQSKGMLEAGSLGLNPNSTVPSCVMVANCSAFLLLSFPSIEWEYSSTYLRGSCKD